jgi:hypothetical protein
MLNDTAGNVGPLQKVLSSSTISGALLLIIQPKSRSR